MALLERVSTLLRANINDLIEKAEDPEKLAKQIVLDMENQLLQVKTQVAIAIADQHLLEKKKLEHEQAVREWQRKAEIAVDKQQDDLARAALGRSLSHQQLAEGMAQQVADQAEETETLRTAFTRLQQRLVETQAAVDLLAGRHKRARAMGKAAHTAAIGVEKAMNRLQKGTSEAEAANEAARLLAGGETLEERFKLLEREDEVERLLVGIKNRQPRLE